MGVAQCLPTIPRPKIRGPGDPHPVRCAADPPHRGQGKNEAHTSIDMGFSISCLKAAISSAPKAPSTAR